MRPPGATLCRWCPRTTRRVGSPARRRSPGSRRACPGGENDVRGSETCDIAHKKGVGSEVGRLKGCRSEM